MKQNSIYIDLNNKEHVDWWNNVASKMVRVVNYTELVETATNKKVGVILMIKGILKNKVIKENAKFIPNSVTTTIKCEIET